MAYLFNPGVPPSNYMNASLVRFRGIHQVFIASQAPLQNYIPSFWQLVAEQRVGVVVMITKLVENKKKKADKYWPGSGAVKQYSGGITVSSSHTPGHLLDHDLSQVQSKRESYPGTYIHRTFHLSTDSVTAGVIEQLQSDSWPDMTAPDDTKVGVVEVISGHQAESSSDLAGPGLQGARTQP